MSEIGSMEVQECMDRMKDLVKHGEEVHLKQLLMETCANMFSQYMCSIRFDYDDIGN